MRTKRIMAALIAAATASVNCYAGNLYLGPTLFLQDNTSTTSNYRGVHPRMSVGYSAMLEDLYLGGEIFAVPFSATLEDNYNVGQISARTTRSYGASVLPGGMITEHVLGFARLGVVSTQFSGPNTSRAGAQIGVGLQTCLTTYWDLRAEYIYTTYKTVPTLGSVKADQVGVGLVYKVIG